MKGRATGRLGHWRDTAARKLALQPKHRRWARNVCFYAGFVLGWVLFGAAIAARSDGQTEAALALFIWALAAWLTALISSDACERPDKLG